MIRHRVTRWPGRGNDVSANAKNAGQGGVALQQLLEVIRCVFLLGERFVQTLLFALSIVLPQPGMFPEFVAQRAVDLIVGFIAPYAIARRHQKILAHSLIHFSAVHGDKQGPAEVVEFQRAVDKVGRQIAMHLAVEREVDPVRKIARVVILFEQEQPVGQTANAGQVQFAIGGAQALLEFGGRFILIALFV